jgi:hypothetical protein
MQEFLCKKIVEQPSPFQTHLEKRAPWPDSLDFSLKAEVYHGCGGILWSNFD